MPRPKYKIGRFDFLTIEGEPVLPREMLELDQRPGVDGTEITRVGFKGTPFSLVTQRDYKSLTKAWATIDEYTALTDEDPQELIKADVSSVLQRYKVQVLDVIPLRVTGIAKPTGGLENHAANGKPAYAWVRWDLIAVEA